MIAAEPIDGPSVESAKCDIGGCDAEWAWEADKVHGPRKLRLCEEHADRWLRGAAELEAEKLAIIAAEARAQTTTDIAAAEQGAVEVEAVSRKIERLSKSLRGSIIAGRRPQPGTAKALATVGRGSSSKPNDKRRVARRRP